MTSPQDDGTGTAPWASPSGTAPPAAPASAADAPGPGTEHGAAPPPAWGAPPAPPGWAAPPPPPGPPPGAWGQPPAPPGWGAAAPVPGSPAWRLPALQPGIVPLRPLGLGEILDGAVRAVRANPAVMFGLSAVVVTVAVALQTLVQLYLTGLVAGALGDVALDGATSAAESAVVAESLSASGAQVLTLPLLVPVTSVLTGLLIVSVSRSVLGRKVALREVWRTRRVWLLVAFGLLQLLGTVLAAALWVGGVVALAAAGADGWAVAAALLGGLALVLVLGWVTVRTLLVPPALMLEGKRFWPTVVRAWRLTRGSFWRLTGTYLLANLLLSVLMYLVVLPAAAIATLLSLSTGSGMGGLTILLSALSQIVGLTLSTTFLAAVVALLYVDVRIRREGLDLELARAAAGDA